MAQAPELEVSPPPLSLSLSYVCMYVCTQWTMWWWQCLGKILGITGQGFNVSKSIRLHVVIF